MTHEEYTALELAWMKSGMADIVPMSTWLRHQFVKRCLDL